MAGLSQGVQDAPSAGYVRSGWERVPG